MWYASNCWLTMTFTAYVIMMTVQMLFTYSLMVITNDPLMAMPEKDDRCPDTEVKVGNRSTIPVKQRLNWTHPQQATAVGAYPFGVLLSVFPGGVYANRNYERCIMVLCMALMVVSVGLVPVSMTHYECWQAAAFLRFLQGFAYGPMDPCGGAMAAKIISHPQRSTYSTFMFSGTIFGRFTVHIFSGLTISCISVESSYYILSALGIVWIIIWVIMMKIIPYDRVPDASDHSLGLFTTPWAVIFKSIPFISLLIASLGTGYLYSLITTGLPVYRAKVIGVDPITNALGISIYWFFCWISSIFAALMSQSLTNSYMITMTTIKKIYAGMVLILTPLMLLGVMLIKCNNSLAMIFFLIAMICLGFERNSIRINSLDLCPRNAGSLMATCSIFACVGNILDSVMVRNLFAYSYNWNTSIILGTILPIMSSIPFMFLASAKNQCWDQSNRQSLQTSQS